MTPFPAFLTPTGSIEQQRLYNYLNQLNRACQERVNAITSNPGQIKSVTIHGTSTRSLIQPQQSGDAGPLVWG